MEENKYIKLSDLVNATFTVDKVWGYQYQMWDNTEKKMLRSDKWQKGYTKTYNLETDKGKLTLRANQLANCLEAVVKDGVADLNGQTIQVKSNGKSGMEIRYFFNAVRPTETDDNTLAEQDLNQIPF